MFRGRADLAYTFYFLSDPKSGADLGFFQGGGSDVFSN